MGMNLLYDKEDKGFVFSVYELENNDLHILFQNDDISGEEIVESTDKNYEDLKNGIIDSLYSIILDFETQENEES